MRDWVDGIGGGGAELDIVRYGSYDASIVDSWMFVRRVERKAVGRMVSGEIQ